MTATSALQYPKEILSAEIRAERAEGGRERRRDEARKRRAAMDGKMVEMRWSVSQSEKRTQTSQRPSSPSLRDEDGRQDDERRIACSASKWMNRAATRDHHNNDDDDQKDDSDAETILFFLLRILLLLLFIFLLYNPCTLLLFCCCCCC